MRESKAKKTNQIVTRITEADRRWVDQEAERQGLDVSSFIRMTLRRLRTASLAEVPAERRGEATHALL